jgi:hypothetical protein
MFNGLPTLRINYDYSSRMVLSFLLFSFGEGGVMFCLIYAALIVRVAPTLDVWAPLIEGETLPLVPLVGPHGP